MDRAKSSSNWAASLTTEKFLVEGSWIDFFFSKWSGKCFKGRSRPNIRTRLLLHPLVSLWNSRTKWIKCIASKSDINQFELQFIGLFCSSEVKSLWFNSIHLRRKNYEIWGDRRGNMEACTPCCTSPFAFLFYVSCTPYLTHW